jgi:hypothetical protein
MRDHDAGARQTDSTTISPAEKLMCEWEARHDVAARGRQIDAAAALQLYLTRARIEQDVRHREELVHRPGSPHRRARHRDEFAARHPLAASWFRWGEDPH